LVAFDYRGDPSTRPDGRQAASSAGPRTGGEIWVMDNFLTQGRKEIYTFIPLRLGDFAL
jgi:hypothetical protein